MNRLTLLSYRHRRAVVLAWIVALVGLTALSSAFAGDYRQSFTTPGAESTAAYELLEERFPARSGDGVDVVWRADAGATDPAVRARVEPLLAELAGAEHVVGLVSPYTSEGAAQVSADGTTAYATLRLDGTGDQFPVEVAEELMAAAEAASGDGLDVELSGQAIANAQVGEIGSEGIGLLAAALILLVTFGSALAMGLPILTALFGLGISFAVIGLLTNLFETPDWATSVAAMIGIGVGIDYALFIVTRYRSELAAGRDPEASVLVALTTAGRAVLFAGTTVVISLLGMFLMGLSSLYGVAVASVVAVLVVMAASVTLLPALLGFVGRGIDRLRVPFVGRRRSGTEGSFWWRWSRLVQRRPWPAALVGLVALVALSVPFLSIRFAFPDSGSDPESFTTRRAYDLLAEGFGPGFSGPLLLAADLPGAGQGLDVVERLGAELASVEGVASATPVVPSPGGDAAVLQVFPATSPQAEETEALVHRLRDDVIPAMVEGSGVEVLVGGATAAQVDSSEYMVGRLPIFIGAVVLLSFLLLMTVFRSVLVALKAAIMNLLSIGAAYGVVGLAVDQGWLGIPADTPVPAFIPMMMFAILFGLSMDYEVFLLSRVREEYLRTRDNALAVADGLASTARVITAAALIMVTVFGAFLLSDQVFLKMIGLGLATAIAVDATLVRLVLVPATMELLGDANWWLPRWLDRLLPDLDVEGAHQPVLPPPAPADPEPALVEVGA